MSKSLIIAEKPSVARDIVAALGGFSPLPHLPPGVTVWESKDLICCHALGHLLELYSPEDYDPKLKAWRVQDLPVTPDAFRLKPKSETAQLLRIIRQQLSRPDVLEVVNACDAAREGELIFREIVTYCLCHKAQSRMWLQSLTPDAIRSAFHSRKSAQDFNGLSNAAHGRAQSDWLIGMNLSRAATLKLARASDGGVWSIGRVQTPTLAMLAEREFAILTHDPKPYDVIKATFDAKDHVYEAKWIESHGKPGAESTKGRLFEPGAALDICKKLTLGSIATASEDRKSRDVKAPPLFSLTSLQRHMANRYKWTAKHTLDVAQKCYESHKVITYPRTESDALPEDYRDKVRAVLNQIHSIPAYRDITARLIDGPWHNESSVFDDKAVKDHFAIIPTGNLLKSLPKDEGLLFDAVIRRLMAALMPAATIDQVERRTIVCGEVFLTGPEEFTRVLGWQEATMDTTTKRKSGLSLKPLKPDNDIHLASVTTSKEETKPPPRIGEAQLLSMMEHAGRQVSDPELARLLRQAGGLGTAATRAEIIENLKNKDYVYSNLQPTTKGLHLIRFLKLAKVEHLTSPQVTAELEQHLEMVESASRTRDSFIQEITRTVEVSLRAMTSFDLEQSFDHAPVIGTCPTCGNSVHERMWNYSCKSNRMTGRGCGFTLPKDCHGRWLDPQSVARLLTSGPNGIILSGFPDSSRMQTPTRRKLALNEGRLTISDEAGTQINEVILPVTGKPGNLRRVTWGPCPIHVADGCLIVETKNAFICEMRLRHLKEGQTEAPGFQLPKSICQQRLKFEDIDSFIKKGKTRVIEGFKSRGGKLFNARVIRNAAGSWTFDFNPTA